MKTTLKRPVEIVRLRGANGAKPARVQRDGGDFGAGLISGFSIITRGEALGHGMWIDSEFLQQVAAAGGTRAAGFKARFTHPGLSDDGLGKTLGRVQNLQSAGDQVLGDMHFAALAHDAPDGDLAGHVMNMAEELPAEFGASIVFRRDQAAMDLHELQHTQEGRFRSPDPLNTKHLPHARLAQLLAIDFVGDPAANPAGMFAQQRELLAHAEAWVGYVLGVDDAAPDAEAFEIGIHADRIRGFVQRFCDQRNLQIVEKRMSNDSKPDAAAPPPAPDQWQAEGERLSALRKAFPDEPAFALEMYDAGKSVVEARSEWAVRENKRLAEENTRLRAESEEAKKRAAQNGAPGKNGEKRIANPEFSTPEDPGDEDEKAPPRGRVHFDTPFWEKVEKLQEADPKLNTAEAMSRVARKYPDLYRAHRDAVKNLQLSA